MNAAQRNRHAALLKATGFEDSPALTVQSTDGEIPHGRELSFAWLTGTVMTGLTSVLLMGAALYVSFQGQDTFSTAYEALQLARPAHEALAPTDLSAKSSRIRPVTQTRSDLEIIEASIRETVDGRDMIRNQPFMRIRATLATAATSLSDDVPTYDPVAILAATQPLESSASALEVNTDIYGAEVEGEVAVRLAAMPTTFVPPRAISDQSAAEYVRSTVESAYSDVEAPTLAYASLGPSVRDLGLATDGNVIGGIAENVTVVPKTTQAADAGLGRTERILTIKERSRLSEVLRKNGFTDPMIVAIEATLQNVFPSTDLPAGARLRILFGPSRNSNTLIPYRMSIYLHDDGADIDVHRATVALTDKGQYVLGLAPAEIEFPEEDTEEVNVANLPSVYRSIWETGRKHDLDDATIERIIGMFAYDIDMNKKISAGDAIEILKTAPDAEGRAELLYVGLTLGSTVRQLYRFATKDGVIDFYDPSGETGKRFLTRRPLEGGGTLRSRFGYRIHPIFKTRKLHTGVDLAARSGTPIYASGDGVVELAGWQSGYGNKVELQHVNGYQTAYGHMSRIADGMKPGVRVRQGQVIGYVGSTGYSTGPHLHFEILINGNLVDPLSVKLPRENTMPTQYEAEFKRTIAQMNDLMARDPAPVNVAAATTTAPATSATN
ncbi:M23 family metallopeptidase [Devosia limi]|uniref:Murein DD-endopeptidase MepM and murein hydrolase activator NlpD, contain LysM domain n=1 Tax=Devosia limi DSM 17137 TaxID=1121477 RepID=A0A1M5FYZ8_9HYPH|nr:M23 family metallopeptidase [Devosia limi]SHF96693.1 Murein DD-endopeptidase MepM and murein hydrolase activator NlpD, contain LysM domain [Devosia limi DSM 17137]